MFSSFLYLNLFFYTSFYGSPRDIHAKNTLAKNIERLAKTFHSIPHPHHHGHLPTPNFGYSQHLGFAPVECEPGANGLFAYPYDCTKYMHCAGGRTYIEDCAPNTAFCNVLKVCTWPQNVNCGTRPFNGMFIYNSYTPINGFFGAGSNWNTNTYTHGNPYANNAGTYPHINRQPINSEGNVPSRIDVPSSPNNIPNQSHISQQHSIQISQQISNSNTETYDNSKPINGKGNTESRIDIPPSNNNNIPNQPQESGSFFQKTSVSINGVNNVTEIKYKWGKNGEEGTMPKPPNTELLPPLQGNSINTNLPSNNRTGRNDETFDARLNIPSGTDSIDVHRTEANTNKPTVATVKKHPTDVSAKIPEFLFSSLVANELPYFLNLPSSTPKPIENVPVNNNLDASDDMLADDPNQSRFGEESPQYYEDTTRVYLKYSKDQEPVMPIYDQPITLTVTQRPYQMPQSYNRKYYQSFIKSANEKDETDGMLISDSMKKLLLPYIAAKKQKVQNNESSDNNPTTPSKQDTQATTDAVVTKPTELTHTRFESESIITTTEKRNLVPSTNTDQYPTRFQPDSTIQQNQGNISPPQNTVQYPPPSNVHPNRVYSHDPDRIVFPGAQSETRRVYGYYHQSQPNRGFTPQLTEMQPVHHRPN